MEHVVFFRGPDGSEGFYRAAGIEEAVRYVEHLRNTKGVEDCKVYSLTEVPLRVKTVYVVELPEPAAPAGPPVPPVPSVPDPLAEMTVPAMPVPESPMPAMPVAELPEPPVAEEPPVPSMPDADFAPVEVPVAEPVASNGKGAGPRGLGFFAR